MKKIVFKGMLALFLIALTHSIWMPLPSTEASSESPSLLQTLRKGGYVLYVRHGEATIGEDQQNPDFNDCSSQRNLSEQGKRQAVQYGETIRKLQIPIATPVQASPFCRTRESAELAFGAGNVQLDPFWVKVYNLSGNVSAPEQSNTLAGLTSVLEKLPPAGQNTVIVAHSFPQGIGLGDIPYLGTVVVKPKGQGKGYDIVDKITLAELMALRP